MADVAVAWIYNHCLRFHLDSLKEDPLVTHAVGKMQKLSNPRRKERKKKKEKREKPPSCVSPLHSGGECGIIKQKQVKSSL